MELDQWAGGVAAVLCATTLLVGIAGLATQTPRARPWLALLIRVNAGYRETLRTTLREVRPVDVLLLVCAAVTYVAFWPGPGVSHVAWMALAIAQPLLGIPVLLATRLWGRSGLMGGGLVLSILMVVDDAWPAVGWLGVMANVLLLVGDFGTTGRPRRLLALALVGGYAALIIWFGWLAAVLLA